MKLSLEAREVGAQNPEQNTLPRGKWRCPACGYRVIIGTSNRKDEVLRYSRASSFFILMDSFSPDNLPSSHQGLFTSTAPVAELDVLIQSAINAGATRLLILAGKPVVCRIDGKLSEPMFPGRLHFRQTEALTKAVLNEQQMSLLDADGSVEFTYQPLEENSNRHSPVLITVFFGDGAHNLVIHLDDASTLT